MNLRGSPSLNDTLPFSVCKSGREREEGVEGGRESGERERVGKGRERERRDEGGGGRKRERHDNMVPDCSKDFSCTLIPIR